uniref:Paired domain-containing protein n=1 Tax=Seriola lalandi dorsalis TaxID=1841481 RepID=A0A3B4XIU1_SERLL
MALELSDSVRSQIVILSKEGLSQRQIMARLKVSKGAVHGTLKRFAESGSVVSKARSGRPKVTTPSEDQYIKLSSLTDRKATSSQIQNLLNKERMAPISRSTVKRRLSCSGLRPLLRRGTKARRLCWAKKHQNFTVDDWKKVLFTGESTFEIDGRERTTQQCIKPTVKHGDGNIQVWGCFASSGVGHLHHIDSALTEEKQVALLLLWKSCRLEV